MNVEKVRDICRRIEKQIEEKNVCYFQGRDKKLFLISENYHGVWLEHVFDSVLYAEMYPQKGIIIAKNTLDLFLTLQKENGQYPCYVWDGARSKLPEKKNIGWAQIQECVSFGQLCLRVIAFSDDKSLPEKCYNILYLYNYK